MNHVSGNESIELIENRPVSGLRKSVGQGRNWTGESRSWMGSSGSDSIMNVAIALLLVGSTPFDEDEGRTIYANDGWWDSRCQY